MNQDFTKYANSFQAVARLRLESITCLLEILDNPHKKVKCIHVAGTNGKGSVCAFLQSILTSSGKKTGKYTSPEMIDVRERISIDGEMIPQAQLDNLMDRIHRGAEKAAEKLGEMPTQFEIWTTAAFLYFYEQGCDVAVIETGLGGERDATNVIENPICSVITRIDMDHMNYLGSTLTDIARAKAGIIKTGCPVITLNQADEAMAVINKVATEKDCDVTLIGDVQNQSCDNGYEKFDYKGISDISPGIAGVNQVENARLAIEVAMLMGIDEKHIKDGIAKAKHPGRFEKIGSNVLFDGTHNPNGMQSLADNLDRYYPDEKKTFLCGFMGDKDLSGIFGILAKYTDARFCGFTVQDNPRAMTGKEIQQVAKEYGINMEVCEAVNDGITKSANDELVIICGSLYTYKDIDFKLF